MPRAVGIIAFSSTHRKEEKRRKENQDLALEMEKVIQRFRQDNREENNLELLLVAEGELINTTGKKPPKCLWLGRIPF